MLELKAKYGYTTISFFRINHVNEQNFEQFFNRIAKQCIEKGIVKSRRYIVDTTDVAANANYPSDKKLVRNAFYKVIKELKKFDEKLATVQLEKYEKDIQNEYDLNESVLSKKHFEITREHLVEISKKLNITIRIVERNMKKLQEANIIVRVGSDTLGYWEIVK